MLQAEADTALVAQRKMAGCRNRGHSGQTLQAATAILSARPCASPDRDSAGCRRWCARRRRPWDRSPAACSRRAGSCERSRLPPISSTSASAISPTATRFCSRRLLREEPVCADVLQERLRRNVRQPPGRHESEQDGGEDGQPQGEQQSRGMERDFVEAGNAGRTIVAQPGN